MVWLRILVMTLTSSFYVSALNTTTATPSLYDKETLFRVIKTVQPMFVAFFSTGSLSLECFNAFNSVADPWLQALLPVYFTLFDTNLDGKLTATDVSPLGVLVTLSKRLAADVPESRPKWRPESQLFRHFPSWLNRLI
ncbi:hypothetical protein BgiMline_031833, partial [Biomphalaria glabrata]